MATKSLSQAQAALRELCENRFMSASGAGSFMEKWALLEHADCLNNYLNEVGMTAQTAVARRPVFVLVVQAIDALLTNMITRLPDFMVNMNMKMDPATALMGLFCIMAQLVVAVEDCWTLYCPDDEAPRWRCSTEGTGFAYVAAQELCLTTTRIKSYTAVDLFRTIDLIALKWYRLEPHPDLRAYLMALLHRACILAGHPNTERAFNSPKHCCRVAHSPTLYKLSRHGLRVASQVLMRMLFTVNIEQMAPRMEAPAEARDAIPSVRKYFLEKAAEVKGLNMFKRQVGANYDRYMLKHTDREEWTDRRGMEKPRAPSLIMTVSSYTKSATTRLREMTLVYPLIEKTDERDADYFERWTHAEHELATIFKLSMATTVLDSRGIDFFTDYAITDLELPFSMARFRGKREPIMVQMFGRMHVMFNGQVIYCTCIEHAVAVWALVILNNLGGRFLQVDVTDDLKRLLAPISTDSITEIVAGLVIDD